MTESPSSSGQMIDPENSSRKGTCIRILCLHGKGGDGKQFLNKSLMPLRSLVDKRLAYDSSKDDVEHRITIEWETLTAPHALDPMMTVRDTRGGQCHRGCAHIMLKR